MNLDRLNHQKTILYRVERERKPFNMASWMQSQEYLTFGSLRTSYPTTYECGTACCAFGYAALDPIFKEQGLKWINSTINYTTLEACIVDPFEYVNKTGNTPSIAYEKNGHPYFDILAAVEFFEISREQAIYIFGLEWYPENTKKIGTRKVIGHINQVIKSTQECKPIEICINGKIFTIT